MKSGSSDTMPTPEAGSNKRSNDAISSSLTSSFNSSITDESNRQATTQERRLDSFARLLEGTSTCAAVCFNDGKILVATNKIHETSRENAHIKLIDQVTGYLSSVANKTPTQKNKEEVFKHICVQNLKGRGYKLGDDVDEQLIDLIQTDLVSQKSSLNGLLQNNPNKVSRALQNHMLISNFICGLAGTENFENTSLSRMLHTREGVNKVIETASSILRLYTDLNKLEASLTSKDPNKSLSDDIIVAFRDNQFEILREGEKDVHAEMRLANRLMNKEQSAKKEPTEVYLGISKLCCPDCSLALRAINEAGNDVATSFSVKKRKIYEVVALDENTTMDTSTEEQKERSEDKTKQLIKLFSRGHHAAPTARWIAPSIMNSDPHVSNEYEILKKEYETLKKELETTPGFKKELSMMYPPESDSSLRNTDQDSSDEFTLGTTKARALSKKKLMGLIREGLEAGSINSNELLELANFVAKKKDIHVNENAFNRFKDPNYQYQGTDIEAIGRQLATQHNFIFAGALGEGTSFLNGSERLKQFKQSLAEDREVVGIYNTGGNHWVTFKIVPEVQAGPGKKTLTVLYKDSFGNPYSEALQIMLTNSFGDEYIIDIQSSKTKEQNKTEVNTDRTLKKAGDVINCGIFALKNSEVLGRAPGVNHGEYYDPANDQGGYQEAILGSRGEYAALYAKTVFEDVKRDLTLAKQRSETRNSYQINAQELVDQLNKSQNFKEFGIRPILAGSETFSPEVIKSIKAVTVEVAITNVENKSLGFRLELTEAIPEKERQSVVNAIANTFQVTNEELLNYDNKQRVIRIDAKDIGLSLPSAMGGDVSVIKTVVSPEEIKHNFIGALNIAKLSDKDLVPLVQPVKDFSDIDIIIDRQVSRGTLIADSVIWELNDKNKLLFELQDFTSYSANNVNDQVAVLDSFLQIMKKYRSDLLELKLYDKLVKSDESGKIELQQDAVEVVKKLVERVAITRNKNMTIDPDEFDSKSQKSDSGNIGDTDQSDSNKPSRSNSSDKADSEYSLGSNDEQNLRRSEKKTLLTQTSESDFLSKLRKSYPEGRGIDLDQIVNAATTQAQNDIAYLKPKKDVVKATVTLLPERSHQQDHPSNIDNLIAQITSGDIKAGTVICLERKQQGNNIGMRDVIVLANILDQKDKQSINLPKEILSSAIYKDALLYNTAKAKGVMVIGIEGKGLVYSKESPEYNKNRDEYMCKMLVQINQSGRDAIVLAGSSHINSLMVKLTENNIAVKSHLEKAKIENNQSKPVQGKYTAQVTNEKLNQNQRDFH